MAKKISKKLVSEVAKEEAGQVKDWKQSFVDFKDCFLAFKNKPFTGKHEREFILSNLEIFNAINSIESQIKFINTILDLNNKTKK